MTLAEAERLAGSDPEHLATVARCRRALGEGVRSALAAGDGVTLERACRLATVAWDDPNEGDAVNIANLVRVEDMHLECVL